MVVMMTVRLPVMVARIVMVVVMTICSAAVCRIVGVMRQFVQLRMQYVINQ